MNDAQYKEGMKYFDNKDYPRALTWFEKAGLSGYTPHVVEDNIVTGRIANVDIGLQKKLWHNKLTAKAAVSDIFYTNNFTATSYYNASVINIRKKEQSRILSLSLVYNFNAGKKFNTKQRSSSNAEETCRLNKSRKKITPFRTLRTGLFFLAIILP